MEWYTKKYQNKIINRILKRANKLPYEVLYKPHSEQWYQQAHEFCLGLSKGYKVPLDRVCGVVAWLSPGVRWETNKRDAETVLRWFKELEGYPKVSTYSRNANRAVECLESNDVVFTETAPKVQSFFWNIYDPQGGEWVTIDRWMLRVMGLDSTKSLSPKQYWWLAETFKKAADKLGLVPCHLQAVLWEDERGK